MASDGLECNVSMRPFVNGSVLSRYMGKAVTIVGTVISVNPKGVSFDLKTSDLQIIIVSMRKPLSEPLSGLVEVHGIVQGRNSMVCDYYFVFPNSVAETYDQELANKVTTLMHTIPNAWLD